ncbi:hypothetical protein AB685_26015 [Bacillus sp. LL01]|nr:hypothetical protein AB685_26015 [Bacillus sp. LL01]
MTMRSSFLVFEQGFAHKKLKKASSHINREWRTYIGDSAHKLGSIAHIQESAHITTYISLITTSLLYINHDYLWL